MSIYTIVVTAAALALQLGVANAAEGNNLSAAEVPAGTGVYHTSSYNPVTASVSAMPTTIFQPSERSEVAEAPRMRR